MRHSFLSEQAINDRCAALGFSRSFAAKLAAETGKCDGHAILHVLGLDLTPLRKQRDWVWMAAKTSSVSYRLEISKEEITNVLASGFAPALFISNLMHFVDEAPIQVVVLALEQISQSRGIPMDDLWRNLQKLAIEWNCRRRETWSF